MNESLSETEAGSGVGEEYLSIKEAAQILGVSSRSVYGYVGDGRLKGTHIGKFLAVRKGDVRGFRRRSPGKIRRKAPRWRLPPATNRARATTIVARVRPGQGKILEEKTAEWRRERKHALEGTSARYVVRDQANPEEIDIVLIWRKLAMPALACREAALAALKEDLAEVLEWEEAIVKEGMVLLHAE